MGEKVIGIAVGMGPASTIELMRYIFAATAARCEQDHIHLVVDSNPKTPDRTRALLGEGESPVPAIRASIGRLSAAGADLVLIPCNTAHAFYDELAASTDVPVLNMIELCARAARERYGEGEVLGILATTGTVRADLYGAALRRHGLRAVVPTSGGQEDLMQAIYGPRGIKAGELDGNGPVVRGLGTELIGRGARAVVAACTEVGLVLGDAGFPVIDPLRLLAEEAVRQVKGSPVSEG